jgi:biopolymer transport protein ExbD
MRRFQRRIPEVDAYWAISIVFLLLVFFIVISSVNSDMGLERRLPPVIGKYTPVNVEPRNILNIYLTDNDELICGNQVVGIGDLRMLVKAFISNPKNSKELPEKEIKKIPLLGKTSVTSKHVISVQCGRQTTYQAYIDVQNELIGAYNDLRDELALKRWKVKYEDLCPERQNAVATCYPVCVSEAEPVLTKGGAK